MEMTQNALRYLLELEQNTPGFFDHIQLDWGQPRENGVLYLSEDGSADGQALVLGSKAQLNHAFLRYQQYLKWRENCVNLSQIELDLNSLLESSAKFLHWDIWIVTPEYKMEVGSVDHYGRHLQPNELMNRGDVEQLYEENPSFDDTYTLRGLQSYPNSWVPEAYLYYYNLFHDNLYLGRILITLPKEHFGDGAIDLMHLICSDTESCYRALYLRKHSHPSYHLYHFWKQVLKGEPTDPDTVAQALSAQDWHPDDNYQLLYLVSTGYFNAQQTLKYYALDLERSFPDCIAAELNGGLYCLHNSSADHNGDFRQRLGEFLRENLFRVGVSNSFDNFFDSRKYRHQAEEALTLGQKRDPSLWRYDFCDYVTDYVLSKCTDQLTPRDLCPGNLQQLLDYDAKNPENQLLQTLYHYYTNQFNAQLAAQKMFIHRTTFFYRMNKIRKIAVFHPEDPRETAQILLALEALKIEWDTVKY